MVTNLVIYYLLAIVTQDKVLVSYGYLINLSTEQIFFARNSQWIISLVKQHQVPKDCSIIREKL